MQNAWDMRNERNILARKADGSTEDRSTGRSIIFRWILKKECVK
jgi:hypothetical protein